MAECFAVEETAVGGSTVTSASVWAVVCAAGAGKRLAGTPAEGVRGTGRASAVGRELERLDSCEAIDGIVVAAPPGWEEATILLSEELDCDKVSTVVRGAVSAARAFACPGGDSRGGRAGASSTTPPVRS